MINVGLCGTVRLNTPGFPLTLLAFKHRFPKLLTPNQAVHVIVDGVANTMAWKDDERDNIVLMLSTVHAPGHYT